jgi:L-cysteine:1D-myo-inositol 2-amino-2-deoxy-alpha-D-glucopyranoside ligase
VLRLYDTRRRGTFVFRPRVTNAATMYVCGVTPYDTTHLGHARTFLVFDVLSRLLEASGTRVRYAQNVTDVDESILQRAARDGVDWAELGRREERAFLDDMRRLHWRKPDVMPHATRELDAMIGLAERLRRRGHAYELPGGLYYDVSTFPRFGELSRYSVAKMRRILASQDDARLDDPLRRSPLDFALWRRLSDGPTWPSPYGRGRPGWHLECSAMSERHLGFPVDIHGGGSDLLYPHHECEIAQSEGAHGGRVRFVRHWVHIAPVRLNAAKMSKSDGNMVFVRDALKKNSPQALRLYLLDIHYRRPFDHDEEHLARARDRAATLADALGRGRVGPIERDPASAAVLGALEDDLHTERAIRELERHASRELASSAAAASLRTIARKVLGIL